MAGSVSPAPSFHLCPDFSIAPPPHGHLQLGSILRALDIDGVMNPLNYGATVSIPTSQLLPHDGPQEKSGFSRSLKQLRGLEGSVRARLFGAAGPGTGLSSLYSRDDEETLTVDKLYIQYFVPTPDYMKQAFDADGVDYYVNCTRHKKPIYVVTGLMWAEGAKLSKIRSRRGHIGGMGSLTESNSGTENGASGAIRTQNSLSSSLDGSTPFILGIRVQKIWWEKNGNRKDALETVGACLGGVDKEATLLDDVRFTDESIESAVAFNDVEMSQT